MMRNEAGDDARARAGPRGLYRLHAVAIYWLLNMSFKTDQRGILCGLTLWPAQLQIDNYRIILTDPNLVHGYIASIEYVVIKQRCCRWLGGGCRLPNAFFPLPLSSAGTHKPPLLLLLTNRMAPPGPCSLALLQLSLRRGEFEHGPWGPGAASPIRFLNIPARRVWILERLSVGGRAERR